MPPYPTPDSVAHMPEAVRYLLLNARWVVYKYHLGELESDDISVLGDMVQQLVPDWTPRQEALTWNNGVFHYFDDGEQCEDCAEDTCDLCEHAKEQHGSTGHCNGLAYESCDCAQYTPRSETHCLLCGAETPDGSDYCADEERTTDELE